MIIDDQWRRGRKETYISVLKDIFNIIPVEFSKELFLKLHSETHVDMYLVDIVLSGWKDSSDLSNLNKPLELITVLRKIGKEKPVILISNQYENLVKSNKLTTLMNSIIEEGFNNIAGFIVWKDFEEASLESKKKGSATLLRDKIQLEILKYHKYQLKKEENKASIGIIAALEEELAPFLSRFKKEEIAEEKIYNYTIYRGVISNNTGQDIKFVAAKHERMGMVDCSYLAATLINKYSINHLFMIGVCGGRPNMNVHIGDIIIPLQCVAYQNGKLTKKGLVPDTGVALSNSPLEGSLTTDYNNEKIRELYDEFDRTHKDKKNISIGLKLPVVRYEEMACGDVIVDKKSAIDEIARITAKRKLCSVDMESYSILRTCNLFPSKIIATVIKSVMDNASKKEDVYKSFAAFMSAGFLYKILTDGKYTVNRD